MNDNRKKTHRHVKKSKRGFSVIRLLLTLLIIVIGAAAIGGLLMSREYKDTMAEANALKAEIKETVQLIKARDYDGADAAIARLDSCADTLSQRLSRQRWRVASGLPMVGEDVKTAKELVSFVRRASDGLMKPLVTELHALDGLELGDISIDSVNAELGDKLIYLADLIDRICPTVEQYVDEFNSIPKFRMERLEKKVRDYRPLVAQMSELLPILEKLPDELLRPTAKVVSETPLASIKAEGGINVNVLNTYITLLEEIRPELAQLIGELGGLSLPDEYAGAVGKLQNKLAEVNTLLGMADEYIPLIKVIVGGGEDRTYLLAAQDSTELRAGGGFPGSMGSVIIRDGVLSVGDFSAVRSNVFWNIPSGIDFTETEAALFGEWYLQMSWDSSFNPHFPRAAQVWAAAYNRRNGTDIDGVISLTPHIIQRILSVTGPITLSDGTELNGDNATKALQYDIYYKYYGYGVWVPEDYVDGLFAECAKLTVEKAIEHLDIKSLPAFMEVLRQSAEDRTFMLWMADEAEEELVKSLGCSGSLNFDPQKPEVGVFYNVYDSDKVGWFVGIDVEMGEGTKNADDSVSYPVTVYLRNLVDDEAKAKAAGNRYSLLGRAGGQLYSMVYLVAPAGGRIDGLENSAGLEMKRTNYEGVDIDYCIKFYIPVDSTITFTYTVITAPGVETEPVIKTTPTLTAYHEK